MASKRSINDAMYLAHRKRVEDARSKIDVGPPPFPARTCLKRVREDYLSLNRITSNNLELLEIINSIMWTHGKLNTYRSKSPPRNSNSVVNDARLRKLEAENRELGDRILSAKTLIDTWHSKKALSHADWHLRRQHSEVFLYPKQIMEKYKDIKLPTDLPHLQQLLRPIIHLDLGVKNLRPLGRITIQLYTEASPQVVMEFVRFAASGNPQELRFRRLFRRLWLEGELNLSAETMLKDNVEFDMRAMDHGMGAGILSYSLKHLMNSKNHSINFAISFKPLSVLNNRRVAFGHITHGENLLDIVQDYGTKNGKPIREIVCHSCGVDTKKRRVKR